jgi:predicted nucleic-acid-binding Zn-ribbon protein
MGETDVKKCPKCGGRMLSGSDQDLDDAFRCTRPKPKKLERLGFRVISHVCENCGFIEFYKERMEEKE